MVFQGSFERIRIRDERPPAALTIHNQSAAGSHEAPAPFELHRTAVDHAGGHQARKNTGLSQDKAAQSSSINRTASALAERLLPDPVEQVQTPQRPDENQKARECAVENRAIDIGRYPSRSTVKPSLARKTRGSVAVDHFAARRSRRSSSASGAWWNSAT